MAIMVPKRFKNMNPGKPDRTSFKHQTLQDASKNLEYWKKQSYEKRLETTSYLNSVAHDFNVYNPGV
jgi:hypothetical protein